MAKGPPCIITGVFSKVCIILGFIASLRRAAILPTAFRSLAYTGSPAVLYATIILESLSFKSFILSARHKMAIISLATLIIKPSSLVTPLAFAPRPIIVCLKLLSFISKQRLNTILLVSIFNTLP